MRLGIVALIAALAFGCAPADVAGTYTVNLTNGDNDCGFGTWDVGDTTSGVGVAVTQTDDQVELDVTGVAGTFLDIGVGGSVFDGQVGGTGITAALIGDVTARMGECVYTRTIDLDADVSGDFIEGELRWRPVTNAHPDCGVLETCSNIQTFNGSRPPTGG